MGTSMKYYKIVSSAGNGVNGNEARISTYVQARNREEAAFRAGLQLTEPEPVKNMPDLLSVEPSTKEDFDFSFTLDGMSMFIFSVILSRMGLKITR